MLGSSGSPPKGRQSSLRFERQGQRPALPWEGWWPSCGVGVTEAACGSGAFCLHVLRKDGVKLWSEEWVLKPGDRIPAKIKDGLERSRVLVL